MNQSTVQYGLTVNQFSLFNALIVHLPLLLHSKAIIKYNTLGFIYFVVHQVLFRVLSILAITSHTGGAKPATPSFLDSHVIELPVSNHFY